MDVTITQILPGFMEYMAAERNLRPKTITGYTEGIRFFVKQMGDVCITEMALQHFVTFKARMLARGCGASRVSNIINAMKCLLVYSRDILDLPVMDLTGIKTPRVPRRRVEYLSPEEVEAFIDSIQLHTWDHKPRRAGYGFRALVETLLATGMRISEALALNRNSIDFETKEAVIIGKGNKQRTVFFTDRALHWVRRYLDLRTDEHPALFVTGRYTRQSIDSVGPMFRRHARWAGLQKHVTPHMLRHTNATTLLRNGCPIGFIKEILGHEDLQTTCRYYLGVLNKADVKDALQAYAKFGTGIERTPLPDGWKAIEDSQHDISDLPPPPSPPYGP